MTVLPFSLVSRRTTGSHSDAGEDATTSSPAPTLFFINNDGRIEAHAEHGTFAYTLHGWVFTPILEPSVRIPVTDPNMLKRLCLEAAGSEALAEWMVNR